MWPFIHKFNSHNSNVKLWQTIWQFEPRPYVNAFRFLRIENNVQIISKIITKSQHCSHGTRSRGEQRNIIGVGQTKDCQYKCKLEYGPMPNLMVALPNIGGALYSMPQSLADADY